MIHVCNLYQVKSNSYDTNYAIVRSYKKPITDIEQMSALSPSYGLFQTYLQLKQNNKWNAESFRTIYVPKFLTQLAHDKTACKLLQNLANASKHEEISLSCFCHDVNLCHRAIIADLIRGLGGNVNMSFDTKHIHENAYFPAFMSIQ